MEKKHKFVGTIIDISAVGPEDFRYHYDKDDIYVHGIEVIVEGQKLFFQGQFEWGQFTFVPEGVL
jgi:hypothetical protein